MNNELTIVKENSNAIFSEDRKYRYVLWRIWDSQKPMIAFIGLNPSTADEQENDNTITRCVNFARDWGAGGIYMLNLFGCCSKDKSCLSSIENPVGDKNDQYLIEYTKKVEKIICAWGNDGCYLNRAKEVCSLLDAPLFALAINKTGEPKHPLYVTRNTQPISYLR